MGSSGHEHVWVVFRRIGKGYSQCVCGATKYDTGYAITVTVPADQMWRRWSPVYPAQALGGGKR